jgi:hypothetical protein
MESQRNVNHKKARQLLMASTEQMAGMKSMGPAIAQMFPKGRRKQ